MATLPSNIYLSGFMAAGKTTIGKALAKKLGRHFVDTDTLIEKRLGKKITAIFSKNGEKFFRNWETRILKELAQKNNLVVSLGGGAILSPQNRLFIKKGQWVHLDTPWSVLEQRLKRNKRRPLVNAGLAQVYLLYLSRQRYYSLAPQHIFCGTLRPHTIAHSIARHTL